MRPFLIPLPRLGSIHTAAQKTLLVLWSMLCVIIISFGLYREKKKLISLFLNISVTNDIFGNAQITGGTESFGNVLIHIYY